MRFAILAALASLGLASGTASAQYYGGYRPGYSYSVITPSFGFSFSNYPYSNNFGFSNYGYSNFGHTHYGYSNYNSGHYHYYPGGYSQHGNHYHYVPPHSHYHRR